MEINKIVIKGFQVILSGSLILLGFFLTFFMLRELVIIVQSFFNPKLNVHEILQDILVFFLYFAFISMVVKYFKENYHFPIRYLLYIGITATIRFIIVNQGKPQENLLLSIVIFVLLVSFLLETKLHKNSND